MPIVPQTDQDKSLLLRSFQIEREEQQDKKSSSKIIPLVLLFAAIACAAVFFFWYFGQPNQRPTAAQIRPAEIPSAPPPTPPTASWIVAGYLSAGNEAIISTEISSTLTHLLVEEGSTVIKGQTIALLDSTLVEAELEIAKGRREANSLAAQAIEVELQEARRVLRRATQLRERELTSQAELDKVQTQVAVLEAKHREAIARHEVSAHEVDRVTTLLKKHTLTSPVSGVVTNCGARLGATTSPEAFGTGEDGGLCSVVDMSSIYIEIDVPETMLHRIKLGATAQAYLDAYPEDAFTVVVQSIAPIANRAKSTVQIKLSFARPDERLRPNMIAKAHFKTNPERTEDD
ncbi:efflux RND transporter periplasmic adaptor subunit [Pseudovibrio denitrificans]|uniref:efflux RND transporter periplasmic adaptor subunit n=1 Tax=Pseudovibrio denitrificans TaxID=258256 RepID=UPI0039BFF7A6